MSGFQLHGNMARHKTLTGASTLSTCLQIYQQMEGAQQMMPGGGAPMPG